MSSKTLNETIRRVLSDESDVRAATAPNQHDFPFDREKEAQVTRREFCTFLALTSTALFLGAAGFAGKAMLDARRASIYAPAKLMVQICSRRIRL